MARASIQLREYGTEGKMAQAKCFAANLTAATFDAQVAAAAALRDAIEDVVLGNLGETSITHLVSDGGGAIPSDPQAQRENVWLVSARETSAGFNAVTFTIPTADLDQLASDGVNMADGANKSALIAAIEAYCTSNDGVAINVESIKFRGRNR